MGRTLPAQTLRRAGPCPFSFTAAPGPALNGCQPWCGPDGLTRAPPPASLPVPVPSPPLARPGPSVLRPACCAGVAAVPRLPRAPSPRRPGFGNPAWGAPRGSAGRRGRARRGPLGAELSQSGRRPRLPEPERRGRQGRGGRREGDRSSPRQSRLGPPGCLFLCSPFAFSPLSGWRGQSGRGGAMPGPGECARAKMASTSRVRLRPGPGPRCGVGGCRAPSGCMSARKGGHKARLPQTCLEKKGA